mmetsp:Transcript_24029/g.77525  ORF Transcript_24029/g.77525 Transcript_24029/m.77525 type:complete len:80 (+) Transcript_24029:186-425(+)
MRLALGSSSDSAFPRAHYTYLSSLLPQCVIGSGCGCIFSTCCIISPDETPHSAGWGSDGGTFSFGSEGGSDGGICQSIW